MIDGVLRKQKCRREDIYSLVLLRYDRFATTCSDTIFISSLFLSLMHVFERIRTRRMDGVPFVPRLLDATIRIFSMLGILSYKIETKNDHNARKQWKIHTKT